MMTRPSAPTARRASRAGALVAAAAGGGLLLAGCTAAAPEPSPTVTVTEPASPSPSESSSSSSSSSSSATPAGDTTPYGSGCASLPNGGQFPQDVSLTDLLGDIPELSAFASAVDGSSVEQQIEDAGDVTVFAPTDTAFTALISSNPRLLLKPSELAKVLQYHVIRQQVGESDLPGSFPTLEGSDVSITGEDGAYVVNGDTGISCGGIRAGNVTVNVVGSVLSPPD